MFSVLGQHPTYFSVRLLLEQEIGEGNSPVQQCATTVKSLIIDQARSVKYENTNSLSRLQYIVVCYRSLRRFSAALFALRRETWRP